MRFWLVLSLFFSTACFSQVTVENPWARASAPGAKVAAGYMTIRNQAAAPDRLVAVSSTVAARVETHVHIREGDVVRMREVKGYDVPAKGMLELKPGGAHLMFVNIARPLKEGDKVAATLKFEKAGEVKVEFHVGRLGAAAHKH
jgi:copper(I)-binding protein